MASGQRRESDEEQKFVRELDFGVALKIYEKHWPDRLILLKGGDIGFVEFKSPSGRLSQGQEYVINWLKQNGYNCYVAYSARTALEEVKTWITKQQTNTRRI